MYEACATYVSKYVTKDLAVDLLGKKCYLASLGVESSWTLFWMKITCRFHFNILSIWMSFVKYLGLLVMMFWVPWCRPWYDDWCSDVRSPEGIAANTLAAGKILFGAAYW